VLGRIAEIGGSSFLLHADQAWRMRLSSAPGAGRLRLVVPARRPRRGSSAPAHEVEGPEALRALRLSFPEVSRAGFAVAAVRKATEAVESAGGAEGFLALVAQEVSARGLRYAPLGELPLELRLPLEIAVDEMLERSALGGAAVLPEREWRETEAPAMTQPGRRTDGAATVLRLSSAARQSGETLQGAS
jgi:hypothetical protein